MKSRLRFTSAAALLVVLALAGCSSSAPELPTVPDVSDMNGAEARDALEDAGYEANIESEDGSWVLMASNWMVGAQSPAAGAKLAEGEEVTITVSKPDEAAAPVEPDETAAPVAPEETATPVEPAPLEIVTTMGLTGSSARQECDAYGKAAFPYGWDPHWIIGRIASEPIGDQWFHKFEATITNEFDAERDAIVECYVIGPDDGTIVTSFVAY